MKETDLAKLVIEWLVEQHWDVYQEVQFRSGGPIADIVAVRNGYLWIIECKTSLTFAVLEQAARWDSHYRSIAVPDTQDSGDVRHLAYDIARNYLSLGVLLVLKREPVHYECGNTVFQESRLALVNQAYDPPLMRENHRFAKRMIAKLTEEHKSYSPAGSNGGGYLTPYRKTMNNVKWFIQENPGCTLKQIMANLTEHHYSTDATAKTCIAKALEGWESWCRIEKNHHGANIYFVKDTTPGGKPFPVRDLPLFSY